MSRGSSAAYSAAAYSGFYAQTLEIFGIAPWLDLVWCELPPGAEVRYPAAAFMPMEDQQVVMLEGRLTIEQDRGTLALEAGDCMRFGAPEDTLFRNPGKRLARYVVARPGGRIRRE